MDGAIKVRAGLAASACDQEADAVHLAGALAINAPDLVVAVWDRSLHVGVLAAGGRVAPAKLAADIHRAERSASHSI
jgi:hypothetical protein